jgi:hypothetical protein
MGNCYSNARDCSCPYCQEELKKGCMSPKFCKPCGVKNKNIKVCSVCGAQYSLEYRKCPACSCNTLINNTKA